MNQVSVFFTVCRSFALFPDTPLPQLPPCPHTGGHHHAKNRRAIIRGRPTSIVTANAANQTGTANARRNHKRCATVIADTISILTKSPILNSAHLSSD
jgi:hypothetical protein